MTTTETTLYALAPGQLDPELVDKAAWLWGEITAMNRSLNEAQQKAYQGALQRAVEKLAKAPFQLDGDAVHFLSESEARAGYEHWNTTREAGCDCRGAVEGRVCWHRPARRILLTLRRWGLAEAAQPRAYDPAPTAERFHDATQDPDSTPAEWRAAARAYDAQACTCPVCGRWTPNSQKLVIGCVADPDAVEFHAFYRGDYVLSAKTFRDAETRLDEHVYELLRRGLVPTEAERAADADEVEQVRRAA